MKKIIYLILVLFVLLVCAQPFSVKAYNTETHAYLTKEMIDFYNTRASGEKFSDELKSFLIDGSRREDDAPRWMNHFYDPIKNRGLSYDPFIDPGMNVGSWQKSKEWANDETTQNEVKYKVPATIASLLTALQRMKISAISSETNYTWNQALRYYLRGDKEKAMFLLGHVIHLIEDTGTPDHTRNDAHPEDSPYEKFTGKFTISNPDTEIQNRLNGKNIFIFSSLGNYFDELANYSNKNFYSKNTIGVQSGYDLPQPDYFSKINNLNYGFKSDGEFGDFPLVRSKSILTFINENAFNDISIHLPYWERLSVKTIQNGSGVMDLFFKEVEQKRGDTAFWQEKKESVFASFFNSFQEGLNTIGNIFRNTFFGNSQNKGIGSIISVPEDETGEENIPEEPAPQTSKRKISYGEIPILLTSSSSTSTPLTTPTSTSTSTPKIVLGTSTQKIITLTTSTSSSTASQTPSLKIFRLRINEIMYDMPGSDDGREWIELFHESGDEIDITTLSLFENKTNHRIELFRGSKNISAGMYAVISSDPEKFLLDSPGFSGNLFKSSFSLSNSGESFEIRNKEIIVTQASYTDFLGDTGDGKSLQYFLEGWIASFPSTPGMQNIKSISGGGGGGSVPTSLHVDFSFSPQMPKKGEEITFSGSDSSSPNGKIVRYEWNFGDGASNFSTSSATTTHAYFILGEKNVTLKVFDIKNESASLTKVISVTSTIEKIPESTHVLLSEILFNPAESDEGKEFIEIYNPTGEEKNLDGWAVRYTGDGEEEASLAVLNGESDRVVIPAKGFLLIGFNNYDANNYANRVADVRRSKSLPNGSEKITITLKNASDIVIDTVEYGSSSLHNEGESIERKSLFEGACSATTGDGEYLGNGCDTDSGEDFLSRSIPRPQNSENLFEPRMRLSPPTFADGQTSFLIYPERSTNLLFSWKPVEVSDPKIVPSYRISQKGSDIYLSDVVTIATNTTISFSRVGIEYVFEITAEDQEGYASEGVNARIEIPSFLNALRTYPDPRPGALGRYTFELSYSAFPFMDRGGPWHAFAIYRNREPNQANNVLTAQTDFRMPDPDGVIRLFYTNCMSGGNVPVDEIIFPITASACGTSGELWSNSLMWSALEDNHMIFDTYASDLAFQTGDYFTIAFYSYTGANGWYQTLGLAATDTTHYPLLSGPQNQYAPELQSDITTSFNGASELSLNLPTAKDKDSIDQNISFEKNYSSGLLETLDESLWEKRDDPFFVAPGDDYLIGVRAKDDFGNVSVATTTRWVYPSTTMHLVQTEANDWSVVFGMQNNSVLVGDTSIFQSFSPEENFSFDTLSLKLWNRMYRDGADVQVTIFPDSGSNAPLASSPLGSAVMSLYDTNETKERTFFFSSPMVVEKDKVYWIMVDVPSYKSSGGHWRNEWLARAVSGDIYTRGQLGYGIANGINSGIYSMENKDLYFRMGKRN